MQIQQNKETISGINLFTFNPEHDLALAVGSGPYTPPAEVVKIRKELALLPALYAGNSDFILLPRDLDISEVPFLRYHDEALSKNLRLLRHCDLENRLNEISQIIPWGWDHSVVETLQNLGIPNNLLPSKQQLASLRELSHRRTAIRFRELMAQMLGQPLLNPARELFSIVDAEDFLSTNPVAYFKAPWSSSGRGIVVSDHISKKGLLEWCHGVVKKQGSVVAEPAWHRVFDFATEWWISNGEPEFAGYSIFETSSRGKYHGNIKASQEELLKKIKNECSAFDSNIIDAQQSALRELIAPNYSGPLGIDMFSDINGNINYCVEINLRLTMGFIKIDSASNYFRR